jgi:hypothetical protein
MDSLECASRARGPVGSVGGGYMLDPVTTERGAKFGLEFGEWYVLGRGGVLGAVDADVVIASFVYFEPSIVRAFWEAARAKREPAETALAYAEAARAWGRERIGSVSDLDELAALLGRVVDDASPVGAPLFGGWRAMPLPDDAPGRAMQLLHVLRELRGGRHAAAVIAGGLSPLEALTCGGPEQVPLFGWAEPAPNAAECTAAHDAAEDCTDRLMEPAFEVLDDGERARLVDLLEQAGAAAAS